MPLRWVKFVKSAKLVNVLSDPSKPIVGKKIQKPVGACRANVVFENQEPKVVMDQSPECEKQAKEMEKLPKNIRKLMKKITST